MLSWGCRKCSPEPDDINLERGYQPDLDSDVAADGIDKLRAMKAS